MTQGPERAGPIRIVYSFVDGDPDDEARLLPLLSAEERARHGRFRFARDRALFRHAHVLLRRTLSELLGGAPESHVFEVGEFGKPALLPRCADLDFNLSHTRGLVACAFAWGAPVGVDVEELGRSPDLEGVGRRVFTRREQQTLVGLAPAARLDRFFEYWTLKEAYMKAVGKGFSLAPSSFELRLAPDGQYGVCAPGDDVVDPGWSFVAFPLGGHRLACAAGIPGARFQLEPRTI